MKTFGLINEAPRATDYVLGQEERLGGAVWQKLIKEALINGERVLTWSPWEPEKEVQRKAAETNACVSFSGNNVAEYVVNFAMEKDSAFKAALEVLGMLKNGKFNASDRRTAKGSGTDPNNGNYVRSVDDYIRNFLFCPEDLWPFTDTMTSTEFYAAMPAEIADWGKRLKPYITIETKFVPIDGWFGTQANKPEELWEALQYSPVWVSVDGGNYQQALYYNHRVCIRGGVYGKYWEVHDSYQNQIVKFPWDYRFSSAKVMQITKNTLADFIQVNASILFLAKTGKYAGQYVGFGDGDILKAIHGEYSKVRPRETRDSLPPNYAGSLFIQK